MIVHRFDRLSPPRPLLAGMNDGDAADMKVSTAPRPYPKELEKHVALNDGTKIFLRPLRPEDERLYPAFFAAITKEDLRLRFFTYVKEFSHAFISHLIQIDYDRAMAFIAIDEATGGILGVVRLHADADYQKGEYAVLVRSDLKGHGLGWLLMQTIIEYARTKGLRMIEGQVLCENTTMIAMCRELGFNVAFDPQDADLFLVSLPILR